MSEPITLDAPIVAVTVYPDRARVTRRGALRLPAGEHQVTVGPLPLGLHADSVRVGGRGPATVLGVDVVPRRQARTTDAAVAAVEEERRALAAELAELVDADGVQAQLAQFLEQLAQRAGGSYARALAGGDLDPDDLAGFADSLGERLTAVRARQRALHERRDLAADKLAAVERRLAEMTARREPDRLAAVVSLAVAAPGDVHIELSYVVSGAGWESSYDLRLDADRLTLTWFGLVRQQTGEDWPEADLALSTARPSAATKVPELGPWFLDRQRPAPPVRPVPVPARARGVAVDGGYGVQAVAAVAAAGTSPAVAESLAEVVTATAAAEQGVSAATYRPARPVAVPADGSAHRATVAVVELTAALDYVTAPVRSTDAHLRATVVNDAAHTFPPGRAAVFHGGEFVGAVPLPVWAPGEEVELALGVDDRIRVEREMVRRAAAKAQLGLARRREAEYRITVANHTGLPARVTVLDQLPVSRDDQITVREAHVEPEPVERTDLGVLTWRLELAPGQTGTVLLGFRVDVGKNVELSGWRE